MRNTNKVSVVFQQKLDYETKKGKHIVFSNEAVFTSETMRELSAENVAAFAIGSVENFINVQRLQGKDGFKLNQPVDFTFKVNTSETDSFSMKLGLSIPRLQRLIEKDIALLSRAFVRFDNVADRTVKGEIENISRMKTGKLIIAKAVVKKLNPSTTETVEPVEEITETVEALLS